MYRFIIIGLILSVLTACSDRSYYRYVVNKSTIYDLDPSFSYYLIFQLDSNLQSEYMLSFNELNYGKEYTYSSPKMIWRQLYSSEGKLSLDSNDVSCDLDYCKITNTEFKDSIGLLSTDIILNQYFENRLRLRTEVLSKQEQRDIIYILIKRKEFVSYYNSGNNSTYYTPNIFYGKVSTRDKMKSIERIEEKLGHKI